MSDTEILLNLLLTLIQFGVIVGISLGIVWAFIRFLGSLPGLVVLVALIVFLADWF